MNPDLDQRLQRAAADFDEAVNRMAVPHQRLAVTAGGARPGRRRRVAFAVVGVGAAVAVLAVVVATRPESSSVVPAETLESPQPIDTTLPVDTITPVDTTLPVDTITPVVTTQPPDATPPTDTTPPVSIADGQQIVVDESTLRTAPLQRTVLYTAGVGSAVDELGEEQCTECEGVSPSKPLLDDDGTIVIDDPHNRRLVVVSDGAPIAVDYPALTFALGHGVLADHLVYLPVRIGDPAVAPTTTEIHVLPVADLKAGHYTIVDRHEIAQTSATSLSIRDGELFADVTPVTRLSDVPLGTPQVSHGSDPELPELIVSFSGRQMSWRLPTGWSIDEAVPMPDGSVAAIGHSEPRGPFAVQLLPTGEAIVGDVDDSNSASGTRRVTATGIVGLESSDGAFEVVHYTLPANNVTMYISNQSFEHPTVTITVSIDGVETITGDFEVGSQHTWITHELSLSPGRHTVLLTSSTGATRSATVDTTWEAHQWMVANHWSAADTPPELTFESFDDPVLFD